MESRLSLDRKQKIVVAAILTTNNECLDLDFGRQTFNVYSRKRHRQATELVTKHTFSYLSGNLALCILLGFILLML